MGIFEPFHIGWNDESYVIAPDRVMGAIAVVEDVVTLKELWDTSHDRNTIQLAKLSRAFGALLRYAGSKITDEEVYLGMFVAGSSTVAAAEQAFNALLTLMVPPGAKQPITEVAKPKKPEPAGATNRKARRAAASSKKRSSSRSASGA